MDKLEAIHEFADECGIDIINGSFSTTKKAACLNLKPHKVIVMDKCAINTRAEEVSILAEEAGHFETGALYVIESTHNMPVARNNRIKYEAQARNWAYRRYLAPGEIELGIAHGLGDAFMAAEFCQVTVSFLHKAIEYHRSCGVEFSFDVNCA